MALECVRVSVDTVTLVEKLQAFRKTAATSSLIFAYELKWSEQRQ